MNKARFEKLLEPYHIGSAKTGNQIIKTSAGTYYRNLDEMSMDKTAMSFYESMDRKNAGLLIEDLTMIDYPAGGHGKQWYSFDEDKYVNEMREPVKRFEQSYL